VGVDYFNKSSAIQLFFLTHFHADHFPGLTRDFFFERSGKIVCSETTQRLLLGRFGRRVGRPDGIPEDRVIVLDDGQYLSFPLSDDPKDTLGVYAIDCCHHCDGALMFRFEHAQCGRVLHTGDFRWTDSLTQREALQAYVGRTDLLVVDTTFYEPPKGVKGELYREFPSQDACVETVLKLLEQHSLSIVYVSIPLVRSRHKKSQEELRFRALGQELLLAAISRRTGMKFHVDDVQFRHFSSMPTLDGCLTTDGASTRLHLCEKGCGMAQYALWAAFQGSTVDADKPLGCECANKSMWPGASIVLRPSTMWFVCKSERLSRLHKGAAVQCEVPGIHHVLWSMHSSANEVERFVNWLGGGCGFMRVQCLRRDLPEPPSDFRIDDEPDADDAKPLHLQQAQQLPAQRARALNPISRHPVCRPASARCSCSQHTWPASPPSLRHRRQPPCIAQTCACSRACPLAMMAMHPCGVRAFAPFAMIPCSGRRIAPDAPSP
jgi:hypothetical protein